MGSSQKKRAREQNASERRERATQKRIDKAAGRVAAEIEEPLPEPEPPSDLEE